MDSLFALAGMGDMLSQLFLNLQWFGMLATAIITVAAYLFRSRVLAGIACCLALMLALLFRPWWPFFALNNSDPDIAYWAGKHFLPGVLWAIELFAASLAVPYATFKYIERERRLEAETLAAGPPTD